MKVKEYKNSEEAVNKVFDWIMNILCLLAAKKTVADPESTGKEDAFRR
jgi:hypothetical protein